MGAPHPVTRPFVSSSIAVISLADEEARVGAHIALASDFIKFIILKCCLFLFLSSTRAFFYCAPTVIHKYRRFSSPRMDMSLKIINSL